MKDKIYFSILDSDAMFPEKREEDAGYDVYACFPEPWIVIKPHETKIIPTGVASAFDKKYVMVLKERGSTGSKGIGQRCGIIDSGYRGEWFVPLTNHNNYPMAIIKEDFEEDFSKEFGEEEIDYLKYSYNKAICQALLLPVPDVEVKLIPKKELDKITSERKDGKLGSSEK